MRVRPDNGRGQTTQAQDDEWKQNEDDPDNHPNHDEHNEQPDPPQHTKTDSINRSTHQSRNTTDPKTATNPPNGTTHNTTTQKSTTINKNTTARHSNIQRTLPNDDPDDFADLLNNNDDQQRAKQPGKPPVAPQNQNNNEDKGFGVIKDEDLDFGDIAEEPVPSKVPSKSSASTYDSRQNSPVRSISSTPVQSTPASSVSYTPIPPTPQGSAPQKQVPSNAAQTPKPNQNSYNDEDDYLDSLQVEDEEMETLSSKTNVAIPSSVTPPSSADAKKYSFLNDDDNLDLDISSTPNNTTTKPSNIASNFSTNKISNNTFKTPNNTTNNKSTTIPSTTTHTTSTPTTSSFTNNKRKPETDEWDDYSFLEDVDDDPPPPTTKKGVEVGKKGLEDKRGVTTTPALDEEDMPIAALTKRKKFVE
jgi:hypothetical protein